MSSSHNFWLGMDVHKESVTIAVFRDRDAEPLRVDRLPYDLKKIRRYVQRLQAEDSVRAWYEASGAGYVLPARDRQVPPLHPQVHAPAWLHLRDGTHWTVRHLNWIRQVLAPGTLAEEDYTVLSEYLALP